MELFVAIALLCGSASTVYNTQADVLKCQKYYINCYETKRGNTYIYSTDALSRIKLAKCVKERKIK